MTAICVRPALAVGCAALVATLSPAHAQIPYDPPTVYYDTATGTGTTLQSNLHDIIATDFWSPGSSTHRVRSYGNARDALQILDQDPLDNTMIVLIYTGNSVVRTWDAGQTWNREHTWPRSRGVGSSGPDNSDLHMLRPCDPGVNSSRSNLPFGIGGGFWDPLARALVFGTNDRGEMARGMFYAATRYDGADTNTSNLVLVPGQPSGSQMGDLTRLLEWHYSDPVVELERRRNHLIFSSADNPLWYQGNRNPFVDRPEFVWAIWGSGPNDSVLFVGAAPAADGSSQDTIVLRGIDGVAQLGADVVVHKQGQTPTTFDLLPGPGIDMSGLLQGRAFTPGTQQQTFSFQASPPLTPGMTFTTLTIDNTDLTSAAPGQGSADANDIVDISIDILTHSVASFDPAQLVILTTIQTQATEGGSPISIDIPIHNLGYTSAQAALDVDAITGLSPAFTVIMPLPTLITGAPGIATLMFDPAGFTAGALVSASVTIDLSDEDLPGAGASQLLLDLAIQIVADVFCTGDANGDGTVNFDDILEVLARWQTTPSPGGPGDANGDGIVNFDDITAVLGAWGTTCAG